MIFTDAQLKKISSDVLAIPQFIVDQTNAKNELISSRDDLLDTDGNNALFYNETRDDIIQKYWDEMNALDGTTHTAYSTTNLTNTASAPTNSVHYPTSPVWANLQPKMDNATGGLNTKGLPTGSSGNAEKTEIDEVQVQINLLENGFSDGTTNTSPTTAPSATTFEIASGHDLAISDDIVVVEGSANFLANISNVQVDIPVAGTDTITYSITAGSHSGMTTSANVRNSHPGFSDTERTGGGSPDAPAVMAYWKGLIDPKVNDWEAVLNTQLTALNNNNAKGADATNNATTISNVNTALTAISTWEGTAASTRYGDTATDPLETIMVNRETATTGEIDARIAEIDTALGDVTQAGDGSVTGSGYYLSLFNWIDVRINLGNGSLLKYHRVDDTLPIFDQEIANANYRKQEYEKEMTVKTITQDATNTDTTVVVDDVSGLSISDSVRVFDDDSSVLTRTINDIQGLNVILNSALGESLSISKLARLVKLL